MKKIISLLAAITVVFGSGALLPETGSAFDTAITASAEDLRSGDLEYSEIYDGTIKITGYSGSETELTIPSEIDGKSVTRIDSFSFRGYLPLTSLTISDGVQKIEDCAFCKCKNLKSVTLPDSVTLISQQAFDLCDNLKSVIIPESVTDIGWRAFGYHEVSKNGRNVIEKIEDFKIYCYKDTEGEKYAKDNGFEYELLDRSKGDVNNDGVIDIEDAVSVIGHVNGQKALTDDEASRADVDGNSVVDIEDAVAIISHVNGVKSID